MVAQSVAKYPSETIGESGQGDLKTGPGVFSSISGFLNQLVPAYPDAGNSTELRDAALWGFFGFFNLLLAILIINVGFFDSVHGRVTGFVSILFALFSFPLASYALSPLFNQAKEDIRRNFLSVNVCLSLAVILGLLGVVYVLAFDREALAQMSVDRYFVTFIFVLSTGFYLEGLCFKQILDKTGFDLYRLVPHLKRIELSESHQNDTKTQIIEQYVAHADIKLGDILLLEKGQMAAYDGIILDGEAQVQENVYSLKGKVALKQVQDPLLAGSVILQGRLVYKVGASVEESKNSNFISVLHGKFLRKANQKIHQFNLSQVILNLTLISLAFSAAVFWYANYQSVTHALTIAVSILCLGLVSKIVYLYLLYPLYLETAALYKGVLSGELQMSSIFKDIKRYAIDFRVYPESKHVSLNKYALIDKRVDEQSFPSVLFALAGRGLSKEAQAIAAHIYDNNIQIQIYPSKDFVEFEGRGFCAKVSGFDFTVGDEDFLLERGVLVQPSDVNEAQNEDGYYWYAALESEVIAYLYFVRDNDAELQYQVKRIRREKLPVTLCSVDDSKAVDKAGRQLGFELPEIYGGLSFENYAKKLESLGPCAFFGFTQTAEKLQSKAEVSAAPFDELRYDLKQSDLILFDDNLNTVFESMLLPQSGARIMRQNLVMSLSLCFMLLLLSVLNLLTPAVVLLGVFSASIAMLLNLQRLHLE